MKEYKVGDIVGPYHLEILEVLGKNHRGDKECLFRCPYCGTLFNGVVYRVANGNKRSCGCVPAHFNDLRDKRFGKLTPISISPNRDYSFLKWICECDCGNIIEVRSSSLTSGNTQSCGCLKSKGELIVKQSLDDLNIIYIPQYSFEDCINPQSGRKLFFDFYLPDYNCCIEYDGEQHYSNYFHGWYSPEILAANQYRDNLKNNYCINNNIKLIRIKACDLDKINSNYIKNLL